MEDSLAQANAVLGAHPLAGVRLASWTGSDEVARFEVFHVEWPSMVFGELVFRGVRYIQTPARTSWSYRLRLASGSNLPSRGDADSTELVWELYTEDGGEQSAFVVADRLDVLRG